MEPAFVEQSFNDIRYYLLQGDLDVSQFTIMDSDHFLWKKNSVSVYIIGESHIITMKNENGVVHEICACTEVAFSETTKNIRSGLLHTQPEKITHSLDDFSYCFEKKYLPLDEKIENVKNTENKKKDFLIRHSFPNEIASGQIPFTEVSAQIRDDLEIQTTHSYPNENTIVRTRSIFSLSKSLLT